MGRMHLSKLLLYLHHNLFHKIEIVGMCVCIFAYNSRRNTPICPKFGMLMPSNQEDILKNTYSPNNHLLTDKQKWKKQIKMSPLLWMLQWTNRKYLESKMQ
jgi:hypothetical protein